MTEALPKYDRAAAIAAIQDSRPPATDRFTYLTIVEANLSVDILPALDEILQDAELTQEIGWDLIYNLVHLPGSEACLETIARLGNPREVILKVLETLELLDLGIGSNGHPDSPQRDEPEEGGEGGGEEEDEQSSLPPRHAVVPKDEMFITLLGMLAILHKRIKTKYPSRFLSQTLRTVYSAYDPSPEVTASVVNLVHSLSGRRRPALPSRKSSINVANPDQDGDASKNAPDPEAEEKGEQEDPAEVAMQQKLLLSFATCILESYTSAHDVTWAGRLLEFYNPERLVPGAKTMMQSFRERQDLLEIDALVGQLVALIRDLGLDSCSKSFLDQLCKGPTISNPLSTTDNAMGPDDVLLSTGGCICLVAYWVFSATIFDADQPTPELAIFPEHFTLLERFLEEGAESQIQNHPGTAEALMTIGLWLESNNRISVTPDLPLTGPTATTATADAPVSDYMRYLHLVTLIALYHPRLYVRNSASMHAGYILHANPSEEDRLRILYDLLENCTFASLKALAVTWLREEILTSPQPTARATASSSSSSPKMTTPPLNIFATPHALETVQYVVFPNLGFLRDLDVSELVNYLAQNIPFLLQAVNFGLFLWSSSKWNHVLPANAEATVRERWFGPLGDAVERLRRTVGSSAGGAEEGEEQEQEQEDRESLGPLKMELDVLRERMNRLGETAYFITQAAIEERERERA